MRVIAGELGGRRLVAPPGESTRPTTDRVREALFNALGSMHVLEGALVADLFAGSGAVGIEALSRGAERCTFVERDRTALRALDDNLKALGLVDRSRVMRTDALAAVSALDADIVFADPPYDYAGWDRLLALTDAPLMVAEAGRAIEPGERWDVVRARRYGRTWVTFLQLDGSPERGGASE